MKRALILLTMISLAVSIEAADGTVYDLIMKGELKAARDLLSDESTALQRDGTRLFCQSLLQPDAVLSAQSHRAALGASLSPRYQEEAYYRLAQYYLLVEDYSRLGQIVGEYRARWEDGDRANDIDRYSIIADEQTGNRESAIRQVDRYLVKYQEREFYQRGLIDKARLMIGHHKDIGARKLLKKLSREKTGPGVPQSLYLLTEDAIRRGNTDDAVFYYNVLRESYPSSIGLDALVDRMGSMSSDNQRDNTAEKITGTYYAVQVGVFSKKSNASNQAKRFKEYGHPVETKVKTISGVDYRVVYVGQFEDYHSALTFKETIEKAHGESFRVVAR